MRITLILMALLVVTCQAEDVLTANPNVRFQIVVTHQADRAMPTVFKIDTWTGKTWWYTMGGKPPRPGWVEMQHYVFEEQADAKGDKPLDPLGILPKF